MSDENNKIAGEVIPLKAVEPAPSEEKPQEKKPEVLAGEVLPKKPKKAKIGAEEQPKKKSSSLFKWLALLFVLKEVTKR